MSSDNYGSGGEPVSQGGGEVVRPARRSVGAISKLFDRQVDVGSSRNTGLSPTTTYTKNTYSSQTSDPSSSTRTTTVSKDGTTTETTITTRSSETFSERVKSSSKGSQYSSYSPSRSTKVTETTYTSDKDVGDKLYDSLIPSSITDGSPIDSQITVSSTETVIVKSAPDTTHAEDKLFDTLISPSSKSDYSPTESRNGIKTTTTTRTSSSTAEDDLYGTLLPRTITSVSSLPSPVSSSSSSSITKREIITVESSRGGDSPTLSSPTSSTRRTSSSYSSYDVPTTRTTSYSVSSTPSDDYSSKNYSYRTDSYDYSSLNSPTSYSSNSYRSNSRSDDMTDQTYSSSVKSVYTAPERTVLEKDLCTYCRKPFTGDAKMVLDDMKINCHASCFKCEVCNSTLGHMKAGDSMWIYKRMVHCENCFEVTREKWRR